MLFYGNLIKSFLSAFLGWSEWSEWSECNSDNERNRFRKCFIVDPSGKECPGSDRDIRQCSYVVTPTGNLINFKIIKVHLIKIIISSCPSWYAIWNDVLYFHIGFISILWG